MPKIRVCNLYPELLNIYGDRGNTIAVVQRARWHGLEVEVTDVTLGDRVDFRQFDILLIGGGQDREQRLIAEDFARVKGSSLHEAVLDGLVVLAICGGYQLMGRYYQTADGAQLPGLSIFDAWTEAGPTRMVGNVVVETELFGEPRTLVGFENHSGRTFLGPTARPLGRVLKGHGNNGQDGREGVVYRNAIGTYLHGSLLPKNPHLTDWLLQRALDRRYGGEVQLGRLDDTIEERAHAAMVRRLLR
ncbi:MAG: glutamine amidotransferase [Firmicutes bacterium]|nr:glutamine amidotransferase [Bacillota bacterium]